MKRSRTEVWPCDLYGYKTTPEGYFYLKEVRTNDEEKIVRVPMTNFLARIVEHIVEDDGAETRRSFVIEARQGKSVRRFELAASEFERMAWPLQKFGPSAIVHPNMENHARTAIQYFSQGIAERRVYAHTGWIERDGTYLYLHAAGAVGPVGPVPGVEVRLPGDLSHFRFPAPPKGASLVQAIRASLDFLKVAPDRVTVPMLAAIYRAPLGDMDSGLELVGPTGVGKSELAARAQQHYGSGMDRLHLPCSWLSTANFLETALHAAKDAVLVVDDHAPDGTAFDAARAEGGAARIFRAQGNRSGRQRMRSDGTLVPAKPPRGLVLSTAENEYGRGSVRARKLVVHVGPEDMDWNRLALCQREGTAGRYAESMAAYIRWLAPKIAAVRSRMRSELAGLREEAGREGAHRRVPEMAANFGLGLLYFLRFAKDLGALSKAEADELWDRWWSVLLDATITQAEAHQSVEPHRRFIELLQATLSAGRAHLAALGGGPPTLPEACGWRFVENTGEWEPRGDKLGWVENADVYLHPGVAYAAVQRMAREQNTTLPVSEQTLRRRLHEHGFLASVEKRGGEIRFSVRRVIEGVRWEVLHLRRDTLLPTEGPALPAQPAQAGVGPVGSNGGPDGPVGPVSGRSPCKTDTDSKGVPVKEPTA